MKKLTTLFFAIMLMSLSLSAHTHYRTLTSAMNGGDFYYCAGDTLIVFKQLGVGTGYWLPGGNPPAQVCDSIILTQNSILYWEFTDGGSIDIFFTIHFTSISPTASWTATDTSKCTESSIWLNAQANPQPDYAYTWNTGSHAQYINVTTPGTYKVTTVGACATNVDSILVLNYPVPAPNLGHDTNTCDGNTITLNAGNFTGYLWNTTANTQTINVTVAGTYSVTVTDLHGCHGNDTIGVTFIMNGGEDIFILTIDSSNGNNQIQWLMTDTSNVTTNIYRGNSPVLVGTTNYADGYWTDVVNSVNQTWTYRISTVNTCGNESAKSPYHTSISTAVVPIVGGGYRVEWTPYLIEGAKGASNYDVFSTDGLGIYWALSHIATVDSNVLSYNLPTITDSMFVVGAEINTGAKSTNLAFSNVVNNPLFSGMEPIVAAANNISIYPNPSTGVFTISAQGTVSIYDVLGNFIMSAEIYGRTAFQLNSGVYLVKILQDKSTTTQKIFIQ